MEIKDTALNSSPATSFGTALLRARQTKNVTLDQAAADLFILKRHLQALEKEDFMNLPQRTFARGFAINYAKYLNLDPQQIAHSFDASYPAELKTPVKADIESPLKPMGTLQREGRSKIRFNPLLILAVIAVIALAIYLARMVTGVNEPIGSEPIENIETITPTEQAEGAAVDSAGVALTTQQGDANQANNGLANDTLIDNTDGNTSPLPDEQTLQLNTIATLTPAQIANTPDSKMALWVRGNTNISIVDGTGKSLMSGNQSRGGYFVTGKPPFSMQIDKVSNVSINLDEQPVKLKQYATNNQASFTLAP